MQLIQRYPSYFTSVSTGILSDINWHYSHNKSLPTLSGAMEIPPVIYKSDKKPAVRQCMEIQQKQCMYIHRYPWVEQAGKIYCRIWVGTLGSIQLWGKSFCQYPGDTVTFQRHSQVCDSALPQWLWWPRSKFFVCLGGGKASSSMKWLSMSRTLNSFLVWKPLLGLLSPRKLKQNSSWR